MSKEAERQAIVFNIQKFSLHDGPGIRTVVFLKGCPLRCKWCANPESQLFYPQILWNRKNCRGCGHCTEVCPQQAISRQELYSEKLRNPWGEEVTSFRILIDHKNCNLCELCVRECPYAALTLEGSPKTVQEVLSVCLEDEVFYEQSGGGVTLSGGEPLAQPEFAAALLRELRKRDINTALETTGFASAEVFSSVTREADLLLFDIKHWNEKAHMAATGVGQKRILANFSYALKNGPEVLPRLPVIPGFNDSLEDAKQIALLLRSYSAARIQLLPFHPFGEHKYELLNQEYAYAGLPPTRPEALEEYRKVFLRHEINAFF